MPRIKRNTGSNHVIGLVVNTFIKPHRDIMLGWMRYGRSRNDIELRFFFASVATSIDNLLEFARSGVHALVLCGLQEETIVNFVKSDNLDIPIVICTHVPLPIDLNLLPKVGVVQGDNEAIGRHVGEFFLEHGLENFAFMGESFAFMGMNSVRERDYYGQARCTAFRAVVMADDSDGKTFREKTFGVYKANGDCWDQSREQILSWVKRLPLPCGVFVNGDRSAAVFVDVCRSLGRDIPGQIEVVSVNNSYGICEGMGTTISSIQPDFDEVGRQSIEMVLKIAHGVGLTAEDRTVVVSSHTLIERSSSLSGRSHGKIVTRAKEFIKNHACDGISVVDVVKHLGVSRRTLELRVKYATGSSVLGLIRKVRFRNICRLLETTDLPLSEVIIRSGYNLTGNIGVYFKKIFGMTMRQYRKKNRKLG